MIQIIIIGLLSLVAILVLLLVGFYFFALAKLGWIKFFDKKKKNDLKNEELSNSNSDKNDLNFKNQQIEYDEKIKKMDRIIDEQILKLESISKINVDDAKKMLFDDLKHKFRNEIGSMIKKEKNEAKETIEDYSRNLVLEAIENMQEEIINQRTTTTFTLKDDNLKGKIIGKDGRNKRLFEKLTGVDLIIEKQPEVTLSCANPIRKELGCNVMESLLKIKNIEPNKIESIFESEKQKFEETLIKYGREAIEDKLHIYDYDEKLYKIVGKLQFRFSYGQNVLQHSIECAKLAVTIADKLNLNTEMAKRAAFFHDIGKSEDFEIDYDHVEAGCNIARKFNFPEYIYNTIECHHNKVEPNNFYASLTKIVDKISASRPGARLDTYEDYTKRLTELENIACEFPSVTKAYAMRSGRILRIILKPEEISDNEMETLGYEIARRIESNSITSAFPVQIILLRENRKEIIANSKIVG